MNPGRFMWVERLSRITCTSTSAGTSRLILFKKAMKSLAVQNLEMIASSKMVWRTGKSIPKSAGSFSWSWVMTATTR